VTDALAVLAAHPSWSQCPVCDRLFTADRAAAAHMTSGTSRTCRDPATVRWGRKRLAYDATYAAWRVQTGDRPPARRTPPPPRSGPSRTVVGAGRVGPEGGGGGGP
jgi:hypothetical protein